LNRERAFALGVDDGGLVRAEARRTAALVEAASEGAFRRAQADAVARGLAPPRDTRRLVLVGAYPLRLSAGRVIGVGDLLPDDVPPDVLSALRRDGRVELRRVVVGEPPGAA
jgi:hypothetical protein